MTKDNKSEPPRLVAQSLAQAMRGMEVGQTCEAPEGCCRGSVKGRASELRAEGYEFATFTRGGRQWVTRLR